MFKSLSLKIATMFILLTISIIILIGAFMTESIEKFYENEFETLMSYVFNEDYTEELTSYLESGESAKKIYESLTVYLSQIGVDSFRNLYLLDGKSGKTVGDFSTNTELSKTLEISRMMGLF